jgi:hypothetical protein
VEVEVGMRCKAIEWVSARVTSLLVTGMLAAAVAGYGSSSLARDNGSRRRERDWCPDLDSEAKPIALDTVTRKIEDLCRPVGAFCRWVARFS